MVPLMNANAYIKMIRPLNLFIIAVLQFILYYGILLPSFLAFNIQPVLNGILFPLFVLDTVIIAAAGYVINDIFDILTDSFNKKDKPLAQGTINPRQALKYYLILIFTGFLIALFIAFRIGKIHYISIYFIATLLLYLYSKKLKKSLFTGNILVSAFASGVIGAIILAEKPGLILLKQYMQEQYTSVMYIFYGFMIFSFLVSLFREIVKDIEDYYGDKKTGAKTLPLVYGVEIAKFVCGILAIIILISLYYWIKLPLNADKLYVKIYIILFLILPLAFIVFLLKKARKSQDFHKISTGLKLIMLNGIFLLFLYSL